jgi:hypothetical protein
MTCVRGEAGAGRTHLATRSTAQERVGKIPLMQML